MPAYLFVYGTLLPGLRPSALERLLAGCIDLGPGSIPGRLYDLGPYPGAVLDPRATTRVRGRVVELPGDRDVLAALDRYEGFDPAAPADNLYLRVRQRVDLDSGGGVACWVYVYNRDPGEAPVVPAGDYAAWRERARVNSIVPAPDAGGVHSSPSARSSTSLPRSPGLGRSTS